MKTVGAKATFAFVVEERQADGVAVEIWAGNQCLTPNDRYPFLPAFLPRLEASEARLRRPDALLQHEAELSELSIQAAFDLLSSQEAPALHEALRWLDWGPTTDDVLCFLIPSEGRLHLTWKLANEARLGTVPVSAISLANLVAEMRDVLGARQAGPQN